MNGSRKSLWERFRTEVAELDGNKCVRCGRSENDGAILHVHHKEYLAGREYWDYPPSLCETLCAGCHAKEHGIFSPDFGWVFVSEDDLGTIGGECDYCGHRLRYSYHIKHPNWPAMDVGCNCCDLLTQTKEASEREKRRRNLPERRKRFIESGDWHWNDNSEGVDEWSKFALGYRVRIISNGPGFRIHVGTKHGTVTHATLADAKGAAFDAIEWLSIRRKR
jgi:DNA-directed RNA polymerase subunit RPC12/RpoP